MTTQTWKVGSGCAPQRPHLVLLVLPFIWQVGGIPFVNEVALRPFGMPFPMVWQMAGVVFASTVFALVFHLDRRAGLEEEEAAFIIATAPAGGAA
ncbi:DUF3311 domain-containing protein [Verminephrobacter eiseniae]|uniref:DUF3311 domain-containing protein n=1 Tax=Verminephrobacter eiseniae (strain EF01-2) TaxID=391735 RepID=A1WLH0_VEREI|nr:DUF3311 domain-containing protein [Verminephrobacter eiseniae]ABM58477.1 hypothetical protein Veis_2735 [Verminephrobacter eiseniae EF01-2]KAB7591714.1 DUF3311 domain-containing protein [Verminephrobacter sp. Larva24]MCW5232084.1 DUF3311 domain-containing protein [Verminephrobacter eiseniae]MCW5258772.1 DUF3311 domain-containing protein [Verminephrobacter eiseniae]MCW5284052.1 DUF3311 domain-containing protein [Verminephrobacter eiseniae]